MGQFRPSQQATANSRPAFDLTLFSFGFLLAAVLSFAIVAATIGRLARSGLQQQWREIIVVAGAGVLATFDTIRIGARDHCSLGPRRQTPKHLGTSGPLGVILWGMDTGTPITTVRATSLPFLGVLAVALGFGSQWIGVSYAGGFLTALWTMCIVKPPRHTPVGMPEPAWAVGKLVNQRTLVRWIAVSAVLTAGTSSAFSVFG